MTLLGHEYSPEIDADGFVEEDISADLIEGEVSFSIDAGTRCLDSSNEPLSYVSLVHDASPAPYADGVVLAAYSLHPNGARFSPPLAVAIKYDATGLPEGVLPGDLALGYYENGAWSAIPSSHDDDIEAVRADIRHFSTVGLLATTHTPSPADFSIRDLRVSPSSVAPMGNVYITFTVRNTGGATGTYPLMVEVNGASAYARELTLSPAENRNIRFWVARSTPGVYTISVDGTTSSFTVASDAPTATEAPRSIENGDASGGQAPAREAQTAASEGIHPAIIALLVMAGVAFLTIVILLLAGVL
jgi:hypothetical protein